MLLLYIITISLIFLQISNAGASNILLNPSFEISDDTWIFVGGNISIDTNNHQSGGNSIVFSGQRNPNPQRRVYQSVNLQLDEPSIVTVSAYSREQNIDQLVRQQHHLQVDVVHADGIKTTSQVHFTRRHLFIRSPSSSPSSPPPSSSPEEPRWQYAEVSVIVPSLSSVTVGLHYSNEGTAWFDDISAEIQPLPISLSRSPRDFTIAPSPVNHVDPTSPSTFTTTTSSSSSSSSFIRPTRPSTHPSFQLPTRPPKPSSTAVPVNPSTSAPISTISSSTPLPSSSASASASASASTRSLTNNSTYTIGLKYLVLCAAADDIRLKVIKQTFDGVGSQYDIFIPLSNNGSLSLTTTEGSGKYLGIVFCTDNITATDVQFQEISDYQLKFGVKLVVFYTYPHVDYGVEASTKHISGNDAAVLEFSSSSLSWTSGYNTSVQFPTDGVWVYPTEIKNSSLATPALNVVYPDGLSFVAAAFITLPNGLQSLQFFVDQAEWAPHSVALGSFWLHWMSNNMYLGLRRIFLNCQLDDLFLESNIWDTTMNVSSETITYRISADELQHTADYLRNLNNMLPSGSNVTVSFPFNGQGVSDAGGYEVDPLFLKAKTLLDEFVWESHTYTHPELDNLTYAETHLEMSSNLDTTLALFGSYNHPRYSNQSMVTPSISGIFNGEALRALWDVGIHFLVGDNSRPELRPEFPYHGYYTTVAVNGFKGMHILPREATYIYYDCSLPDELESEYNHLYRNYYGKDSTTSDIVYREGKRVALLLLAFRNDPYMFHQANLREFTNEAGETVTLLSSWIDSIISEYSKYYSLPLHGHNHDLLSQKYLNREARDACGFSATVSVNSATKQIVSVQGTSEGECEIALTGVRASAQQNRLTEEIYGPDILLGFTCKEILSSLI
eukprot:TRINITY_DN2423_c2_g1_i3.p1 TRINITY_DN2423_c2_g1~~TRINITY_DN2423_c2_g1_i3.p1  ORF type:complete len:898 (+),score=232.22 TRINITY_DN2423_c2_g1_i3:167-2860(+)